MPSSSPDQATVRLRVDSNLAAELLRTFPGATAEDSIQWLLGRYQNAIGDTAACANTELWIKLDRMEEAAALLALALAEHADIYRRLVGAELGRMRDVTTQVATLAELRKGEEPS